MTKTLFTWPEKKEAYRVSFDFGRKLFVLSSRGKIGVLMMRRLPLREFRVVNSELRKALQAIGADRKALD